ncbi:3'-5' exonuclease [Kitasatospora sp. NPDC001527]|uniref:3'-5' exonuclease n=1 Tax=Kitasatospora sp. NPDC001527 TaxID=3154519 RepID=UPI00332DB3AE
MATDPILHAAPDGRHTYRSELAPDHLLTRSQLRATGLSEAGLKPAGWLHVNVFHTVCPLYDPAGARPIRSLTDRQREALARGRLLAGTVPCAECSTARVRWREDWDDTPVCDGCELPRRLRLDAEAAAARRAHAARVAEDKRLASRWARQLLDLVDVPRLPLDGPAGLLPVVLDTETTGLDGYLVEVAVVRLDGVVLLEELVHPQIPIPPDSTGIHGITDSMVAGALTFGQLLLRLAAVLQDRQVLIWNAAFDVSVIRRELGRLHRADGGLALSRQGVDGWLGLHLPDALVECAMTRHAEWWGAWDSWHRSYTWQKLTGPRGQRTHRAAADCHAVLHQLRLMANDDGTDGEVI